MPDEQNFDDIKVQLTKLDICIEAMTILVCAATWGFLIFQVVVRENFPNVFGIPPIFFVLSYVFYAVMNYCVFAVFTRIHYLNKPLCKSIKITKENAEHQYRLNARFNCWMRLCLVVFVSCLMIEMNLMTTDTTYDWYFPVGCCMVIISFMITLYYHVRAWMLK